MMVIHPNRQSTIKQFRTVAKAGKGFRVEDPNDA